MSAIEYSTTLDVSDVRLGSLGALVQKLQELAKVVPSKADYLECLEGPVIFAVPSELRITWSVGDDGPCCAPDLWLFRDVFEDVSREVREWTSNTMARPEPKT